MTVQHDTCSHGHSTVAGAAKDPVCGMTVDPQKTRHRATHAGTYYVCCSAGGRTKFDAEAARYLAAGTLQLNAAASTSQTQDQDQTKDPVCGMTVDPQKTPHRATHAGTDYFFCSAGCRTK